MSYSIQNLKNLFMQNDFSETEDGIELALSSVNKIFFEAGKLSLRLINNCQRKRKPNIIPKKWFDRECRTKRVQLRHISNKKHRDPQNAEIRSEYHDRLKNYKSILSRKKESFINNKIAELTTAGNNQNFWRILKSIDDNLVTDSNDLSQISPDSWIDHFQNLHKADNEELDSNQTNICEERHDDNLQNELDRVIAETELNSIISKLKNKKSPGNDKIRNEMTKCSFPILKYVLLNHFSKWHISQILVWWPHFTNF